MAAPKALRMELALLLSLLSLLWAHVTLAANWDRGDDDQGECATGNLGNLRNPDPVASPRAPPTGGQGRGRGVRFEECVGDPPGAEPG